MNRQAYKDEVQPGEKAPARVENTIDAFKYPPQQKKSKRHIVLFIIASVCVLAGLLLWEVDSGSSGLPGGGFEHPEGIIRFYVELGYALALVSGAILFLIGLIVYLINRKSR